MTNHEIEAKIRQAVANAAPDVLDSVLADCEGQKGTMVYMAERKKNAWIPRVAGLAAALAIIVGGAIGVGAYRANHAVASTVSLDVNPSIEITVNRNESVIAVTPLNEEGRLVIGDMDFAGSDIDVCVNALIGSMLRNGYLNDIANSILVSVDNADPAAAAVLQERLAAEINGLLQTDTFSGAVLSQTVSHGDAELQTLAETYGITTGKAELIRQLTAHNTLYTFEELAALSINELNLLSESGSIHLDSIASVGTASDKGYIGRDAALAAACSHAGVAQSAVGGYEIELDFEYGQMVYELEFYAGGLEYEYDVGATTGEIISHRSEYDNDYRAAAQNGGSAGSQAAGGAAAAPDSTGMTAGGTTTPSGSGSQASGGTTTPSGSGSQTAGGLSDPTADYISREAAIAAALSHAGVSADAATPTRAEFDYDDGRAVYEVEFYADGYEYDYEVSATDGAVVKYSREREDDYVHNPAGGSAGSGQGSSGQPAAGTGGTGSTDSGGTSSTGTGGGTGTTGGYIGEEAALNAALSHAGVSADAAAGKRAEFDYDDGRAVYEIEFRVDRYEYEYEIDAATGAVLKSDREYDD